MKVQFRLRGFEKEKLECTTAVIRAVWKWHESTGTESSTELKNKLQSALYELLAESKKSGNVYEFKKERRNA